MRRSLGPDLEVEVENWKVWTNRRVPQQDNHEDCSLAVCRMLHPCRDDLLALRLPGQPVSVEARRSAQVAQERRWADGRFLDAVKNQPALAVLDNKLVKAAAVAFFAAGQVFVLSSMWVLGVTGESLAGTTCNMRLTATGTYLGDYFGILMTSRVTGFPFNVLNDPMYIGSFLTHVGTSLWFQSPVGLALSFWVLVVYLVALRYEG